MLRPSVSGRNLHSKFGETWRNGRLFRKPTIG